jgi:hypothetical protein
MTGELNYFEFVKNCGKPVSELNPGSSELALPVQDSLKAIDLLEKKKLPIVGGDVLSLSENNKLKYAYQVWGTQYHCLSWYCDKLENENYDDYRMRSYEVAKLAVKEAKQTAEILAKECFIVLVI